jgi:DNA-directed RNA polymerase subunit F
MFLNLFDDDVRFILDQHTHDTEDDDVRFILDQHTHDTEDDDVRFILDHSICF